MSTEPIYLGMGSNLLDRVAALRQGLSELSEQGVEIRRVSSVYDTDPVGFMGQSNFLNLAVEVAYPRAPLDLLHCCLEIERRGGRVRGVKDGPRTLDIDILLWGADLVDEPGLEIPHPRLPVRRFVLVPLAEIAGGALHPSLGLTIQELLDRCPDPSGVRRVGGPDWVVPSETSGYNPAASRGQDG